MNVPTPSSNIRFDLAMSRHQPRVRANPGRRHITYGATTVGATRSALLLPKLYGLRVRFIEESVQGFVALLQPPQPRRGASVCISTVVEPVPEDGIWLSNTGRRHPIAGVIRRGPQHEPHSRGLLPLVYRYRPPRPRQMEDPYPVRYTGRSRSPRAAEARTSARFEESARGESAGVGRRWVGASK